MSAQDTTENKEPKDQKYAELVERYNKACGNVDVLYDKIQKAKADDDSTPEDRDKLLEEYAAAVTQRDGFHEQLRDAEKLEKAKDQHRPIQLAGNKWIVREPDMYTAGGRSFFTDLYLSELKGNPQARERISKHHSLELDKRPEEFAVTSTTLGGIIPPAYLVDLYAKASRNGRVYADQANGGDLPDVGMSIVVPRLTVGLSVCVQATENTALTTSDPTEVDLTVPVRTIGGFSPVSRQSIERAAYSDRILFEDLIARYWALLDSQCINGSGAAGQILGVLGTAGISTSTASTATVAGVYPKIAD